MFNDDRRSSSTAECLLRWFQSFESQIQVQVDSLQSLTLNPSLDEIWRQIIDHYHDKQFVKKVKESIRIDELKRRHPDRWQQQKNVHLQQSQIEQRVQLRLKEISSIRCDQSINIHNELERLRSIVDQEKSQVSSLDKQLHFYREICTQFDKLQQVKVQLDSLFNVKPNNEQKILNDILVKLAFSDDQSSKIVNLNEFVSSMNVFIQQRTNKTSLLDKEKDDRPSSLSEVYDEAVNKVNLEFTKQFIHLSNVRHESIKVRDRLDQSKREVISKRSINEQSQLSSILEAMISSKSTDVHLSLLKKKVQGELDQNNKFDENILSRLHQQINERRNQLAKIEHEFNRILQSSPIDQIDKIESKLKVYSEALTELPKRLQSFHLSHLSLSNEIRSKIFNWPIEQFSNLKFDAFDDHHSIEPMANKKLCSMQSDSPVTPLKSLKQLLGIRTQDNHFTESFNQQVASEVESQTHQRWKNEPIDDPSFEMSLPEISPVDWSLLSRLDEQIEENLKQSRLDFDEYSILFDDLHKEIELFSGESSKVFSRSNSSSIL